MAKFKKIYQLVFLFFLSIVFQKSIFPKEIGLTNSAWEGRLGDNIFHISKCLMMCDKFNIPFYFRPFKNSHQFQIHNTTQTIEQTKHFKKEIRVNNEQTIREILKNNNLDSVLISFKFGAKTENHPLNYFNKRPALHNKLKYLFTPLAVQFHELPNDMITVAVHVRKGSGIDGPLASNQAYPQYQGNNKEPLYTSDKRFPLKFPPDHFYIEAIKKLSEIVDNKALYVYVFTDYPYPEVIIEHYKKNIDLSNIIWAKRDGKFFYDKSTIDDLHFMSQFDCLIRPDSYFSIAAQLIGNHSMLLLPMGFTWKNNNLFIKKIGLKKLQQSEKIGKTYVKDQLVLFPIHY